jgi:hypothetical protein
MPEVIHGPGMANIVQYPDSLQRDQNRLLDHQIQAVIADHRAVVQDRETMLPVHCQPSQPVLICVHPRHRLPDLR